MDDFETTFSGSAFHVLVATTGKYYRASLTVLVTKNLISVTGISPCIIYKYSSISWCNSHLIFGSSCI